MCYKKTEEGVTHSVAEKREGRRKGGREAGGGLKRGGKKQLVKRLRYPGKFVFSSRAIWGQQKLFPLGKDDQRVTAHEIPTSHPRASRQRQAMPAPCLRSLRETVALSLSHVHVAGDEGWDAVAWQGGGGLETTRVGPRLSSPSPCRARETHPA